MKLDLQHVRALLLSEPQLVLHDPDIMRALVAASDAERGENVIDLRGVAINRLESRLTALEKTHDAVLAAAYDNVASTNQIHRAVLAALEAKDWNSFVAIANCEFREILNVAEVRLCLEAGEVSSRTKAEPPVMILEPGAIDRYVATESMATARSVVLRRISQADPMVYGEVERRVHSEAVLRIDAGKTGPQAMVLLGSNNPEQFVPSLKPDLLDFLGQVLGRMFQKWLHA